MNSDDQTVRPIRWRGAAVILILAVVGIVVVWAWPEWPRQQRYLRTAFTLIFTGFALVLWLLFWSRLRRGIRLGGVALLGLLIVAIRFSFEIRGVNGDLLPIVEPRWKAKRSLTNTEVIFQPTPSRTNRLRASGDFVQFYGPNRDGVLPGPELERDWSAHPPELLWKQRIGAGWGGFAVKDGLAVTLEQRGERECTFCYDLFSGRTLWTHGDSAKYSTTIAGEGPRSTPTISSNRVYTFGATGILNCLDLSDGKLIWSRAAAQENGAKTPDWGFACSPLVTGGQVVVSVGGTPAKSLVAYAAADGQPLWAEGTGGVEYSSPIEATLLGERQIINFGSAVTAHNLKGKVLWSYPWPGGHPHVTPPMVVSNNSLLVTSGYGTGAELIQIEHSENKWTARRIWKSMALKSKFAPIFRSEDYIYGLDDGILTCLELRTGQRQWKDGRYGHGQGLMIGQVLLLTSEKGEIILIHPDPKKLVEVARFKVFNDKSWNPPALAGEYLLIRNDKEAACLKLKTRKDLENI
ncbi:MAG TPA: PQQ-binding-like beta-propeller repeat protein [Verrucomicrobiae bacterium]|nr:PQQ-binding-like beta-propeller repeat protein [Verrucomicrobiae bacterium]